MQSNTNHIDVMVEVNTNIMATVLEMRKAMIEMATEMAEIKAQIDGHTVAQDRHGDGPCGPYHVPGFCLRCYLSAQASSPTTQMALIDSGLDHSHLTQA